MKMVYLLSFSPDNAIFDDLLYDRNFLTEFINTYLQKEVDWTDIRTIPRISSMMLKKKLFPDIYKVGRNNNDEYFSEEFYEPYKTYKEYYVSKYIPYEDSYPFKEEGFAKNPELKGILLENYLNIYKDCPKVRQTHSPWSLNPNVTLDLILKYDHLVWDFIYLSKNILL